MSYESNPSWVPLTEAAEGANHNANYLGKLLAAGRLPVRHITRGRRTYIHADDVEELRMFRNVSKYRIYAEEYMHFRQYFSTPQDTVKRLARAYRTHPDSIRQSLANAGIRMKEVA